MTWLGLLIGLNDCFGLFVYLVLVCVGLFVAGFGRSLWVSTGGCFAGLPIVCCLLLMFGIGSISCLILVYFVIGCLCLLICAGLGLRCYYLTGCLIRYFCLCFGCYYGVSMVLLAMFWLFGYFGVGCLAF